MLLQFSEQIINDFIVPSFTLTKGDVVIIRTPDDVLFRPFRSDVVKKIISEVSSDVESYPPLKFVDDFKESGFLRYFFPATIASYHKKYANTGNPIYKNIYDTKWLTPQIKVKKLANNLRKKLALYTTLSWTNNIVFDLAGIDPQGGQEIYEFVKTIVNAGGAAILIDHCDEFRNYCTKFIKVKRIDNF